MNAAISIRGKMKGKRRRGSVGQGRIFKILSCLGSQYSFRSFRMILMAKKVQHHELSNFLGFDFVYFGFLKILWNVLKFSAKKNFIFLSFCFSHFFFFLLLANLLMVYKFPKNDFTKIFSEKNFYFFVIFFFAFLFFCF